MARPRRRTTGQTLLPFDPGHRPKFTLAGFSPHYSTPLGDAYCANALDVLRAIPDASINAVVEFPAVCPSF